ncbi:MAG: hypothetical protein JST42_04745, partial [Bacteroidetes bacterium]|nr:hypothetical protein [Bacteroidota bacterium]
MIPKLFIAAFAFFLFSFRSIAQPLVAVDSLALVDLYNATNGPNWVNHTNWLTTAPVRTWYGVGVYDNAGRDSTRVVVISLAGNHLLGQLPASLGNLTALLQLTVNANSLSGALPSSIGNLSKLGLLELSQNLFSGSIPSSFANLTASELYSSPVFNFSHNNLSGIVPVWSNCPSCNLDFSNNNFNYSSFDPRHEPSGMVYSPQGFLPLIDLGGKLTVAAGGDVTTNTYTWFKDGILTVSVTGDSTFAPPSPGNYSVQVITTAMPGFALFTQPAANTPDSLALVDLYNNTGGASWFKNANWLTTSPVGTWCGVTVNPYNGSVSALDLANNNLTGVLPPSIGNLSSIQNLALTYNQLGGGLPASIGNLSNLVFLELSNNQISAVPDQLCTRMSRLTTLGLNRNQLTGSIPDLGENTSLHNLVLSGNQLSGSFLPLKSCKGLQQLDLSYNQFADTLPGFMGDFPDLNLIDLSHNHMTGKIPGSLCHPPLSTLILSSNRFTGTIPDSIANFSAGLYLDSNQLSGRIPASLIQHTFYIANNRFNFSGMDNFGPMSVAPFRYSPQANLPITLKSDSLSIAAGGQLTKDTFRLYKDGALAATQTGDSSFAIGTTGKYNIVATSPVAPGLALYSDTLNLGLALPNRTMTYAQTVSGSATTDLTEGIFRLVSLRPTPGPDALSGAVTTLESVDDTVTSYNGQPYVQRHYDITPAANAASSQATVTLYFSQADFDEYNNYVIIHNPGLSLLPANGTDNGNLVITQYHGSFTGTSAPANYSQGSQQIIPSVAWDASNGWWAVSFPVSGFSGFFLSTVASPLPLTLLNFTAVAQGAANLLKWQTVDETGTSKFVVQRSGDGRGFVPIGTVAATDLPGTNSYSFTDRQRLNGDNFYRLQMTDLDGKSTYSPVIVVGSGGSAAGLSAYPNPAKEIASVLFGSTGGAYSVLVYD